MRAFILGLTVLCLTACTSGEQTSAQSGAAEVRDEFGLEYEKYTLENGLDVILHVDTSDPVVAVASVYHVGSSREEPGRTGFAHFFEHMTFNDSENVPRGANRKYIPELGGTRNGGTSFDYTMYYEVVPKDALEKIFWIDSDRMGYMINTVTEAALEREKQVVKNEKRQRVDNAPYGHTGAVLLSNLFPDGHPYSWSVIGSLEDLENATLDDVKKFYERWYGANNATFVVAGDFDPTIVKLQIEQWFGDIPRGPSVESRQPQPVVLDETMNLWYPDGFAKLPELTRTYPTVENYHEDIYALDVLARYLSDSKRSPLYLEIVEEQQLAPEASVRSRVYELAGSLSFKIRAMADTKLDDVEVALDNALVRFEEVGIPENELKRIKAQQETSYYEQLSSVQGKANLLAKLNEFAGDPGFASDYVALIKAVTADDVMRVFEKYVNGRHFIQTSFVPKDSPGLAISGATLASVAEERVVHGAESAISQGEEAVYEKTPSRKDRSEPPLGELPALTSPEIWSTTLSNGIAVIGIEDTEIPLVSFTLSLPGGQWLDAPDRTGTASLLANLLMQGTASRTPAEMEEAIGLLGANVEVVAASEAFEVHVVTLKRNLEATVALVEEILLEPRWDEIEFERIRNAAEAHIIAAEGDAYAVAVNVWYRLVYGEDHPYGQPRRGSRETIANLTIDDLKGWHADYIAPAGASLQVVGSVDALQITSIFGEFSKRWTGAPRAAPGYKLQRAPKGKSVYFVDVPGAKQSVLVVGKRAVKAGESDWTRLRFANQEFGGGSSGRLMQLLRIEKGYTYGAGSRVGNAVNVVSPWFASSSVRTNVTLESMKLIRDQIVDYAVTFTDQDTAVTRNLFMKRNARAYETPAAKLNLLNRIAQHGLTFDIVAEESAMLQTMTTDDYRRVIVQHLNESDMIWVIVGDGTTQRNRLKEFGYGDPVELDRRGYEIVR